MNGIVCSIDIILELVGLSDVISHISLAGSCSTPGPAEPVFSAQRDRVAEAGSLAQVWNPAVLFGPCSFRSCALYAHSRTHALVARAGPMFPHPFPPPTRHNDYLRAAAVFSLYPHLCSLIPGPIKEEKMCCNFFIWTHKMLQHSMLVHIEHLIKNNKIMFSIDEFKFDIFYKLPLILPPEPTDPSRSRFIIGSL